MEAFGPWAWDGREGCWSGVAEMYPGQFIDIHLRTGDAPETADWFLPRWEWFRAEGWGVRAFLASELHEVLHEYAPGDPLPCPEEIAGRLTLLSAAFEPGGVVELSYHDGMLCGGRRIAVPVGPDGFAGRPAFVG